MEEDEDLARFQLALLTLLHQESNLQEIQRRLKSDPEFAPFQAYIDTFDPRALEIAAEITKRWAVLKGDYPQAL